VFRVKAKRDEFPSLATAALIGWEWVHGTLKRRAVRGGSGAVPGQRAEVNIVLGPISPAGTLGPSWRACGGA
jgi:hypothetical protein